MKKLFILFVLILTQSFLFSQNKDPYKILETVKSKFSTVKDYEADIKIIVDYAFIKVPEMNAKIYFKAPDKVKLDSKQFAMLPKQALTFTPAKLLSIGYTALYANSQNINGIQLDVIKIIPLSDTVNIAVSTLWVDPINNVVRKVESTLKQGGTFQFNIDYSSGIKFALPSSIKFTADLPNINNMRQMNPGGSKDNQNKNKSSKGTVDIYYANYKVNKGIPDSIFKDSKK
jgi:outer membrane lipoprotein-sorting protein